MIKSLEAVLAPVGCMILSPCKAHYLDRRDACPTMAISLIMSNKILLITLTGGMPVLRYK